MRAVTARLIGRFTLWFFALAGSGLGCSAAVTDGDSASGHAAVGGSSGAEAIASGGAPAGGAFAGTSGAPVEVAGAAGSAMSLARAGAGGLGGASAAGAAGSGGGEAPSTPRAKMLAFIAGISGKKTLAGEHNRESGQGDFIQKMKDVTGHFPALWGGDFLFEPNEVKNRPNMIEHLMAGWKGGSAISLMYHACAPTQPDESCQWDSGVTTKLSDAEWSDLTTDGGKLNAVWKSRLDAISPYFDKLKAANIAPIFRIFHEMNQSVFWWAGRTGPSGTAKLFQLTHDYMVKTKGFDNIVWVWSIQDIYDNQANGWNFGAYNPGSDYWDIMSLDFYDGKGYTSDKYDAMLAVAGDKPIAIGECQTLPTAKELTTQPRWVYFLGWSELVQKDNSNSAISALYTSPNVLNQDGLLGW
jgi:mannan endo-1,4-beta-mannosidase